MAVMDCATTSRTIAQQIQSISHHLVSACTIRDRLQQSGMSTRCPLLRLSLTRNHRMTWTTEYNGIDTVFTDESRFCLKHHDGRNRVERHNGERLLN
ncbi:transposable element Tcb1 transposase [Trichonephila clavipes]|nr:transposable element Tcb1 transposase [Trichonephila clavipes]